MTILSSEVVSFLHLPIISIVATINGDGSPHLTPVWHLLKGDRVFLTVENHSKKASNLRNNPKISLCVATWKIPQEWVMVNGKATIHSDRVHEMVRAISVVYKGEKEGNEHADRVLQELDFVLVSIKPRSVVSRLGTETD